MTMRNLSLFILLPILFNTLFIGFYFSGSFALQQLISPIIPSMPSASWREFGIMEQGQNILLIITTGLLLKESIVRIDIYEKIILASGSIVFLFVFLEEVDYGIHFYEYFFGESGITHRNWHNQKEDGGHQNIRKLRRFTDAIVFLVFIVLPLLKNKKLVKRIKHLIPSRWFIAGFVIATIASRVAHGLEDYSFDVINGVVGGLTNNISEFRETSSYYFFMLYALHLTKTQIINKNRHGMG